VNKLPNIPNSTVTGKGQVESEKRYDGTGGGLRVLLYSHDTFGLGHLQRSLKISRALKHAFPELSILLVTGSPQVHRYLLPGGIDYIKLPAVRKTADEEYEPRTPGTSFKRIFNLRSRLLLEAVKQYRPHILLVDHSPLGMKGEMIPSLEWHYKHSRDSYAILGLRDIIDEPAKVIELWKKQHVYDAMRNYYDNILIYGASVVFDPVLAYDFPADIIEKTRFCGYITDIDGIIKAENGRGSGNNGKPFVVVTTGGGDGAGETVVGNFLEIMKDNRTVPFESLIITGPFVSSNLWTKFRRAVHDLPTTIRRFVPRTRPYLVRSDLVISTGGYNTTTEVLSFGRRGLVIPRIMYRQEQLMRAQRLSSLGLLSLLHPCQAYPEKFFETIKSLLSSPEEPLTSGRQRKIINMDGAYCLANIFGEMFMKLRK
jgi:predicted glycosyltransferase